MNRLVGTLKRWIANESDSFSGDGEDAAVHDPGPKADEQPSAVAGANGTVRVGRTFIVVSNPQGGGMLAVCVVPDDERLIVTIDGHRVVGRMALTRDQVITLSFVHIPPERTFTVEMSSNRMQVSAHKTVRAGTRRRLEEVGPAHEVTLRVIDEEWMPEADAASTLVDLLADHGFQGDPDDNAIGALCSATYDMTRVVLRGKTPVAGRAERYRPCGLAENWTQGQGEAPWVAQGALVAELEGAVAAAPGRDVTGEELLTFEDGGRQAICHGVRDTGATVVAARSGRVLFTRARIDVVPELVLEGDLTARDGQVMFDGDIFVRGSLLEGASVKASGRVAVSGDVLEANVEAGRDVAIAGAVLRSNIHAGLARSLYQRAYELLVHTRDDWSCFEAEYRLLLEHAGSRPDVQGKVHLLANVLLSQRYRQLDDFFAACASWEDSYYLRNDPRLSEFTARIRRKWQQGVRQDLVEDDVRQLTAAVKSVEDHLRMLLTEPLSTVSAHSVSSSQVDATGDIVVHGVGVFSSHMESGQDIVVEGVVRGGFVLADRTIHIGELGSPVGVESSVRVNRLDGSVQVGVRHGNTVIDMAGRRSRSTNTEHNVKWGEKAHDVQTVSG